MNGRIRNLGLLAAAFIMITAGCSRNAASPAEGVGDRRLQVVATFYPMAEFARQVAGDRAEIITLLPPGTEPHDWEPNTKQMKRVRNADLFVYNGAGFEHWATKALKSMKKDASKVVEAAVGLELMEGLPEEEEEHGKEHKRGKKDAQEPDTSWDPHVWLDPVLAQQQVRSIQSALERIDPGHAEIYRANGDTYVGKLQELDASYRRELGQTRRKDFITQHAAFGYLAKRYGLTQVPIAGLSPLQEPLPARMSEIIRFAKEHEVRTIFFETLVAPNVAAAVAREVGANTSVLNPLEGLTEEEQKQNLDYIGIMQMNLKALVKALNE
ncbi:metal ABC transporter solute-binding protein, Zn/Mn family [Gorillibacterium sp. sgz5001074]|uniref:metal ABC transporter solute-binding protein, Zn/Mn family n=1 Tax=Gorillibacterium sp. sgz5001074 TaxID=3446695 RepID=UPI003F66EAD2